MGFLFRQYKGLKHIGGGVAATVKDIGAYTGITGAVEDIGAISKDVSPVIKTGITYAGKGAKHVGKGAKVAGRAASEIQSGLPGLFDPRMDLNGPDLVDPVFTEGSLEIDLMYDPLAPMRRRK